MKEFTVVRKGYAPEEVKAYVEALEKAVASQSAQIKEYQDKEAAITSSMVEAQLVAAQIKKQAVDEANAMRAGAYDEMDQLRAQVLSLHDKLTTFQSEYGRILQEYLVSLRSNDLVALFGRLESFMKTISVTAPTEEAPQVAEEPEATESEAQEEA